MLFMLSGNHEDASLAHFEMRDARFPRNRLSHVQSESRCGLGARVEVMVLMVLMVPSMVPAVMPAVVPAAAVRMVPSAHSGRNLDLRGQNHISDI